MEENINLIELRDKLKQIKAINKETKIIDYLGSRKLDSGYAVFKNDDVLFAHITPSTEHGKVTLAKDFKEIGYIFLRFERTILFISENRRILTKILNKCMIVMNVIFLIFAIRWHLKLFL